MAVSPGGIMIGFRTLEKLFPAPSLESLTKVPIEQLTKRYKSRDRWGNWLGFLAFLVLSAAYTLLIFGFAALTLPRSEHYKHVLHPVEMEYVIYGIFLSLLSFFFFLVLIYRWALGKKEYDIYMAYGARRMPYHFHVGKAFQWFFLVLFIPLALMTVLRVSMYTAFTDQAMLDSPFGSFGAAREHPYKDVTGVYLVNGYHGRFRDYVDPVYVIAFKDGFQWDVGRGSGGPRLEKEQAVIKFVTQRSGKPIRKVQFVEEIPR
jgi:hypothetical protein